MNLYKSGYIVYSSSLSQSIFDVTESINYSKTYNTESIVNTALTYDGTNYTAYVGLLSLDTKGISERKVLTNSILSYVITGSTINFRSKTLPEGVENKIKLVSYSGNLDTDSAYSIISSSHQSLIVGEIDLTDYYTYTTGSDNYQSGTLVNSGSFTVNISSSVVNRYGYTNLIGYVDHLYQKKDFNEKENQILVDDIVNDSLGSPNSLGTSISSGSAYIAFNTQYSSNPSNLALQIYKNNFDGTFTKLSSPSTQFQSEDSERGISFSKTNTNYLIRSVNISPYIRIFKRSGDIFSSISNPTQLPTGNVLSIDFTNDDSYVAMAHANTPYISMYSKSGDTFTKTSNPGQLPTNLGVCLNFSNNGTYLSLGSLGSPYLMIYKRSGSSLTLLSSPTSAPQSYVKSVKFSPDDTYLAIAQSQSPLLLIYKRNGDSFSLISNPTTQPLSSNNNSIHFNSTGDYLFYGSNSTQDVLIYKRNGDNFEYHSKMDGVFGGTIYGMDISNENYLSSAHISSDPKNIIKKFNIVKDNYTQTILSSSDIGEYTVISQSIPNHVYNKIIEPSTTGTITFSSSLSESVYNASSSLEYSRSYGELISSVELDDNTYTCKVGFVSFDVPVYKSNSYTYTASINIKFNQNSQISRSNVLPDEVENKLYIVKYNGDVLSDDPYNIITSSYQIPQSNLVNTVDLSKYYTYNTSSDSNVASSSNIGYYTASIIVPDEYITYGETNNFLVYNDQFVKKQDFINQVEGYDIEQGLTKLEDPSSLPAGLVFGSSFSSDNTYLAIANSNSPNIVIYKRSGDTFTKLANPDTLPVNQAQSVTFSSDDVYLVFGHISSPFITIYKRSGDTFTKLADPTSLPVNRVHSVTFSSDNTYLATAHFTSPFITIYKRSGDTFTKLADPTSLPTGNGRGVSFSSDNTYLAIAHDTSPFITIYKRSGDTFTKLTNPTSLPANSGYSVSFSINGDYLAVGHISSPFITIYKRSGDTFTKLTNPTSLPIGDSYGVSFSSDDVYLTVGHNISPYLTIYKKSGDTFTKLANPDTLPTSGSRSISISHNNAYLVIGNLSFPYVHIYGSPSITQNKTSFRLNPDIELEIDVKYPVANLVELMGVSR